MKTAVAAALVPSALGAAHADLLYPDAITIGLSYEPATWGRVKALYRN